MRAKQDLTGMRFSRWTVIENSGRGKKWQSRWNCKCDCGTERELSGHTLMTGHSKSCGCLRAELATLRMTTHGKHRTRTARIWYGIWARCNNPKVQKYSRYGGRGISVCERWRSFESFLSDMGECPDGFSIERIDNDGNYCKENCVWASRAVQARNRCDNHMITWNGEARCITDWAIAIGTSPTTISTRLAKGWDIDRVFTHPIRGKRFWRKFG